MMSKAPDTLQTSVTRAKWAQCRIILLCLLSAACKPSPELQASRDVRATTAQSLRQVAVLPLQRGYYVASDTPCAKASNATLLLLRRNGIGGARYFCEFKLQEADIFEGDILVVDRSIEPAHGHIVVAFLNEERLVKRLSIRDGNVSLLAGNSEYPPLTLKGENQLDIWGVAIGKFKRLPA